jgi:hypothetical protein
VQTREQEEQLVKELAAAEAQAKAADERANAEYEDVRACVCVRCVCGCICVVPDAVIQQVVACVLLP